MLNKKDLVAIIKKTKKKHNKNTEPEIHEIKTESDYKYAKENMKACCLTKYALKNSLSNNNNSR